MEWLFSESEQDNVPDIPGLAYVRGYLSHDEERALVHQIDASEWDLTWERRRQPYGNYGKRQGIVRIMPDWGQQLAVRLCHGGFSDRPFDQMLVNEYLPGQGITLHTDYKPFDRVVASISLLSACIMEFRHVDCGRREELLLEPRSLLVLADEARYQWQHGISKRKRDRWAGQWRTRGRRLSVTFRLAKQNVASAED